MKVMKKGSGNGHLPHSGPTGNLEGGSFTRDFGRLMKGDIQMEHLCLRELCEVNLEGDSITGDPKVYAK